MEGAGDIQGRPRRTSLWAVGPEIYSDARSLASVQVQAQSVQLCLVLISSMG
jgi:hypothetical protein